MGSEFPGSHGKLHTPSETFENFHYWIHMSNQEYRVFHPRRYLSFLAILNTRTFHFLFLLCNRETHFGRCPILPSPPSNTNHSVDLPPMHSHPFHAMSRCICKARCHCMLYHVTCIMKDTWTTQSTPVSWTITSLAYDFHKSFYSCQPIMQTYINIHIQHVIQTQAITTSSSRPIVA